MERMGYSISLDRKEQGANMDFVSHAHSDHIGAAKSSQSILLSDETASLLKAAYNIETEERRARIQKGIRMIDSGHMLGAKQLVIEEDGGKVVYTGDFQMDKSRSAPKIEIEEAETIIMDSTYPYIDVSFDQREDAEQEMQKWVEFTLDKGIILFGAYVMGKAQEIIKILNEIGVVPVVNKKISEISKVYKEYGVNLEYTSMYDNPEECEESLKGNFVGITDNASMRRIPLQLSRVHEKKVYTAVATGFSKIFRFYTDAQFCISDHADVKQSMDYINASGAKRVLTYGRGKEKLARVMQRNGLAAGTFA